MSFKASGPKTRPERVKPPSATPPTSSAPLPPSWSAKPRRSSASSASSSSPSFHDAHFPPEEEQRMLDSSNSLKKSANSQFAAEDYSSAISTYDRARAELPTYLDYELAVLQSNIAACHVKLEQWKEAIDACESGLASLERELPTTTTKKKTSKRKPNAKAKANGTASGHDLNSDSDSDPSPPPPSDDTVIELPSDASDNELAAQLKTLNLTDARKADIQRIRTKLLLRRARANSSLFPPTWSALGAALADYRTLAQPEYLSILPASDQVTVRKALVSLPGRVNEAKDKEVGEMMGKLKEVGNGILKPFGLSTDMFKMVKDEGSGGWSMSFDQGGGAGKGGGEGEKS